MQDTGTDHGTDAAGAPAEPAALTRHLESRYHTRYREALPALIERARRVEMVHAGVAGVPAGLGDLLEALGARLSARMAHAEETTFPAIRAGRPLDAQEAGALRAEHAAGAGALAEMRRLTGDITLPPGACRTWTALYEGLRGLASDLEAQARLEEGRLLAAGPADAVPGLHKGCACHG